MGTYEIEVVPACMLAMGQNCLGTVCGTSRGTVGQTPSRSNSQRVKAAVVTISPSRASAQPFISLRLFSSSTPAAIKVIESMHTAPTVSLSGTSGAPDYAGTYVTGGSAANIASSSATISAPDSTTLTSMTVTIQNPLDESSEQLQAVTTGTSITRVYANGVLKLTGVADVSDYQTVLQSITYSDSAMPSTITPRTISVVVSDGTMSSAAVTTTLTLEKGTVPSGYSITADQSTLDATTVTSAGFTFANAVVDVNFAYSISSSGGGTPVTGTDVVTSATENVSDLDLASLPDGTITYSVTLSNGAGVGPAATATATLNTTAPKGYSITADQQTLDNTTASAASFTFAGAEKGDTFNYTVTSNGGATTPVTGSGTINSATQQVTGINVTSLPNGTLTFSVTLTNPAGNTGAAATAATTTLYQTVPIGYSITPDQSTLDNTNAASASFTFANAQVGATYTYSISGGSATPVTGNGTVTSATQDVTGINVSSLPNGTITYSVTLSNGAGTGQPVTQSATLDQTAPTGYTITADQSILNITNAATAGFTFTNAVVDDTYSYTVSSSGGGTPVTGSGTVALAGQDVTPINVSSLPNGTLTFNVTLANGAGTGQPTSATTSLVQTAPSGYTISANEKVLNNTTSATTGFTFANAVAGTTYSYSISSSGGGTPVTGSGIVASVGQDVTPINVASLPNGTLSFNVTLTNGAGSGLAATATTTLEQTVPSGYTIVADQTRWTARPPPLRASPSPMPWWGRRIHTPSAAPAAGRR